MNWENDPAESGIRPEESPSPEASPPKGVDEKPKAKRKAAKPKAPPSRKYTAEQKLVLIDTWKQSSLTAKEFTELVSVDYKSFSIWKARFEKEGPAGLFSKAPGPEPGSRVEPMTRKTILLLKEHHPEFGCERISQMLFRGSAIGVSASTVNRVLKEEGYESEEGPTRRHPDKPRRFERAKPGLMWQSDLFCFKLKRNNHMVHLVAYMDDHSRFLTGIGLASSATSAFVLEVVRTAIGNYGPPEEMLTDRGPQYKTWRGKTTFEKEMKSRGIEHIVSRPRHPQTLGKVERFWKTLWNELLKDAIFTDINDARRRIELYTSYYNFQRPHQGIDGLVPADRFFGVGSEVREMLEREVSKNALELARAGKVNKPFYMTGSVGDSKVSVHSEGDKLVMTRGDGRQEEVSFEAPVPPEIEMVEARDLDASILPVETAIPSTDAPVLPAEPAEEVNHE